MILSIPVSSSSRPRAVGRVRDRHWLAGRLGRAVVDRQEHADARRVDEADPAEIEHDGVGKRAESVDRALQLGCRVQVDLSAHLDDERVAVDVMSDRQLFGVCFHSALPGPCSRSGRLDRELGPYAVATICWLGSPPRRQRLDDDEASAAIAPAGLLRGDNPSP